MLRDKILEFLAKRPTDPPPPPITPDTKLFDEGVVDSFGLVELIEFLQQQTGRTITDDEINDPRFISVAGIVEVLEGKKS